VVENPWWHNLLTIADLGKISVEEVHALDPSRLAEMKRRLGFNTEHITCGDTYGGVTGVFYFRTSIATDVPRDFIGEYLPEAHKRGIKVLIYYNVHRLHVDFGRKHPEWLQVDSRGRIVDYLYGSGCAPCVNSSWREWSFQGIRDLAKYEIDGIFLDGPIFAPGACYCKNCRKLFMDKYGMDLPKFEDWKNPAWRHFIEFRYESIARYLRDAEKALKEVRPEAIIYMNCTGLWPSWPAARDNRRLMPHQDLLGAEGGFIYSDLRKTPLWKPGMAAKLLETQASGKPTVIFIAGAHKPWDSYLLTPVETKLLYADTVSNGANPWYGIPSHLVGKPGAQGAAEMNRFLVRNSEFFAGTRSLATVAILWSCNTADFYRASVPVTDFTPQGEKLEKREKAGNFLSSFMGCYEILTRSHIPFDIIDENAVNIDRLSHYEVLFIPNCACLPNETVETIEDYIRNGGKIVASFETSLYNEYGEFIGEFGLSSVLGIKFGTGTFGPMKIDYMKVKNLETPITKGLSSTLLPCPVFGIDVYPTTAEPLAFYLHKMPARYVRLPPVSDRPAILLNRYGNGKSLFFAGNFFEHYWEYHIPDYRKIIVNALDIMGKRLVSLRNCPSSVEVTLRYQPGKSRLMIHLVNFTAEMTRPIERVVTLKDIDVVLYGFREIKKARALWIGRDLKIDDLDGNIRIHLPVLHEYEVIVLEPIKDVPR